MTRNRRALDYFPALMVSILLIGCGSGTDDSSSAVSGNGEPAFSVDPTWPLEMPNSWIMGSVTAVFVDSSDHVWVTHLPETLTPEETSAVQDPPLGTCCVPAPVVIKFDADGTVVQAWRDPSTQEISEFPRNAHGLFVDHNDFVWVGTFRHHRVMKFTRDGRLVMTIGEYDVNNGSDDTTLLGGPAGIWVDPDTNEAYIADAATAIAESSSTTATQVSISDTGVLTANRRTMTTTSGTVIPKDPPASSPPSTGSRVRPTG